MVLADTSMFIDFWKRPTREVQMVFEQETIVICGVVRAELLHGAISEKNFQEISNLLASFDELNLESSDWQMLGEQLYRLRTHGITVPLSDAIIASVAIKNDIPVWSGDQHFVYMQKVLGGLKLYKKVP